MNKNFNKRVGWKTFWCSLRHGDFATARRITKMAKETLFVRTPARFPWGRTDRSAISQGPDGRVVL